MKLYSSREAYKYLYEKEMLQIIMDIENGITQNLSKLDNADYASRKANLYAVENTKKIYPLCKGEIVNNYEHVICLKCQKTQIKYNFMDYECNRCDSKLYGVRINILKGLDK